jgi:hypothetical protein
MSHEFYQIMVGSPTMSLYSWKQLARWSIDYSCLSDTEKSKGHEILNGDWEKFCDYVINQYGGLMVGDGGLMVGDGGLMVGDGGLMVGDGGLMVGDGGLMVGDEISKKAKFEEKLAQLKNRL